MGDQAQALLTNGSGDVFEMGWNPDGLACRQSRTHHTEWEAVAAAPQRDSNCGGRRHHCRG